MQDPRMPPSIEITVAKPKKKKGSTSKASLIPFQGNGVREVQKVQGPPRAIRKATKRNLKNEGSPPIQQQERSNSDSLPDSSNSGNEYRALRRKYLLLEEENFDLGRDLKMVEDEVKTLEDEKLALLDELVVLEGLIQPSEMLPNGFPSV